MKIKDWNAKDYPLDVSLSANDILEIFNEHMTTEELTDVILETLAQHSEIHAVIQKWLNE